MNAWLKESRILAEPLTAPQKGTVCLGGTWETRHLVAVFRESCTEIIYHLGCDAVYLSNTNQRL